MARICPGSSIVAAPSSGESRAEFGRVLGIGLLRGKWVAYVRYERPRCAGDARPWLDTLQLTQLVLRSR